MTMFVTDRLDKMLHFLHLRAVQRITPKASTDISYASYWLHLSNEACLEKNKFLGTNLLRDRDMVKLSV